LVLIHSQNQLPIRANEFAPTLNRLQSHARAAYLGLAIGDALGATVEFMTPTEIHHTYGVHNTIRGGGWLRLPLGQVTDDTTMSLALGRAIIEAQGFDTLLIARAFDQWMRSKPVDIGNTVRRGLMHFRRTGQPQVEENEMDGGNGACMRCLPVALATFGSNGEWISEANRRQAHVTHNNPLSDAACECVITLVQMGLAGYSKESLLNGPVAELIKRHPQFIFDQKQCVNPTGYVVETLQAVLQAFFETNSFEACLVNVVNRGGDADTTGAIAGMIAGAFYGLESLPQRWRAKMNKTVFAECEAQAVALVNLTA
jgi:ADP-ribosyl-[dinitrogen reductase] hydrolase